MIEALKRLSLLLTIITGLTTILVNFPAVLMRLHTIWPSIQVQEPVDRERQEREARERLANEEAAYKARQEIERLRAQKEQAEREAAEAQRRADEARRKVDADRERQERMDRERLAKEQAEREAAEAQRRADEARRKVDVEAQKKMQKEAGLQETTPLSDLPHTQRVGGVVTGSGTGPSRPTVTHGNATETRPSTVVHTPSPPPEPRKVPQPEKQEAPESQRLIPSNPPSGTQVAIGVSPRPQTPPAAPEVGSRPSLRAANVVTDSQNRLMWQDEDYLDTKVDGVAYWSSKPSGKLQDWDGAVRYCRELRLASYTDWRLPNIKELQSAYQIKTKLQHVKPNRYWSSTLETENLHWHVLIINDDTLIYDMRY